MPHTVLFFGDSNTRGYGLAPEQRFAAVLERDLAGSTTSRWQFEVASSPSDLKAMVERLQKALDRYRPDILVWQCFTGPASYEIDFPPWMRRLRSVQDRYFAWRTRRAVSAEVRADPSGQRTERDAIHEGRYVDQVFRYRPGRLLLLRRARALIARRYGLVTKATRERYLQRMLEARSALRSQTQIPILFLGILPLSDTLYPGYHRRAFEWGAELERVLPDPAQHTFYIDMMTPLAPDAERGLLLNDATHLTVEGHRRVACLVRPLLLELMLTCERSASAS